MPRFTSKGTYITDTEDCNRSYDMSGMGDVISITRMLNSFAESNNKTEVDALQVKLNNSESQRNEAVLKLNTAEEHICMLCSQIEAADEKCTEQDADNRTVNYDSGPKVIV